MLKRLLQLQAFSVFVLLIGFATQYPGLRPENRPEPVAEQPTAARTAENREEAADIAPAKDPAERPVKALPKKSPEPLTIAAKSPPEQLVFPVVGYDKSAVISFFGDKRGKSRLHQGVDIKADRGTPLAAVMDGKIESVKEGGSGGKQVWLRGTDGRLYFYAHLDSWSVGEDDQVAAGDIIGTVGNTGNASKTIPHLHFEIMLTEGRKRTSIDPLLELGGGV